MSHITIIKTTLTNLELIKNGIKYLGLNYKENSIVRMWSSRLQSVLVIEQPRYDLGFFLDKDGNYIIKADSFAWNSLFNQGKLKKYKNIQNPEKEFIGILEQACNIVKIQLLAQSLGHQLEISEQDETNNIHARILI